MNKYLLMSLILGVFAMTPITLTSQTTDYSNIQDCFKDTTKIELIIDNTSSTYDKDSVTYNEILSEFEKMLVDSHQAPAFGVSLDDLTRQEKQTGVWLEFYFNSTCTNSEMPFESLLINVQNDFYGFNIIRCYQGKYEGRCFYINLKKDMSNLYNLLITL